MGPCAREQQQWVVQPLIDAGLQLDRIRELVFHLAFVDVVSSGSDTLSCVSELVADQPARVRTAWGQTITRMLTLEFPR